jgi:5-methylcytosine-specific restriction endonuclease McrA
MPFKDIEVGRARNRAYMKYKRTLKRLGTQSNPEQDPLLLIAERLVGNWQRSAERMWEKAIRDSFVSPAERARARVRRHRAKYPERVLASAKRSYAKHREKRRTEARERYLVIREAENARSRAYYAENAEAIAAQKSSYHRENAEHLRAKHEEWCAKNPERIVGYSATRRACKANAPINDFTPAQWLEIQVAFDHRCAYCGKRAKGHLTQDHITPLSKGGPNTAANVIPACQSCNSRKHDKAPLTPVQPLLLTIAPSRKPKAG